MYLFLFLIVLISRWFVSASFVAEKSLSQIPHLFVYLPSRNIEREVHFHFVFVNKICCLLEWTRLPVCIVAECVHAYLYACIFKYLHKIYASEGGREGRSEGGKEGETGGREGGLECWVSDRVSGRVGEKASERCMWFYNNTLSSKTLYHAIYTNLLTCYLASFQVLNIVL